MSTGQFTALLSRDKVELTLTACTVAACIALGVVSDILHFLN